MRENPAFRRRVIAAIAPAVLLAGLVTGPVAATAGSRATATTSTPTPATSNRVVSGGTLVHAGVGADGRHPALSRPFFSRVAKGKGGGAATAIAPAPAPSGPAAGVLGQFAGSSLDSDDACCGGASEQAVEPPDTQIAAGPSDIVEAVNSVMRVTDKSGNQLSTTDLNTFFQFPAGYSFTDPRVEWDNESQRWFLSGFGFNSANDSDMKIATSNTADPTGSWTLTQIVSKPNVIADQPKLGFDSTVVVLAWDDYDGNTLNFTGSETWVLQKSDLVAGTNVHVSSFPATSTQFSVVPAQSYDGGTTAYAAENDSCGNNTVGTCSTNTSNFALITLTGTPTAANVARSITHITMAPTSVPPNADEPGASNVIATNDDRFLNDVLVSGVMYVTGNDACKPSGDTTFRPCGRLLELTPTTDDLFVDSDIGTSGKDIYFPAPIPDPAGNLALSATESNSSLEPSSIALTAPAGSLSFTTTVVTSGTAQYKYGTCQSIHSGEYPCRWGDYSGAARDPASPNRLWLASEWGGTSDNNWATEVYDVSFRQMTITPSTTTAAAGTPFTVTVTATDGSGATLTTYTGTVHFTSTDPAASLPADYTFTNTDAGSHTFSVTLNTAGVQTITVTDAANDLTATTPPITVSVGPTVKLAVAAPAATVRGEVFSFTVTAEDAGGNTTPAYTGTVQFTSSDGSATLPSTYTFVTGDHGVHTFQAELQTLGTQTITATDQSTPSITGTATIQVSPPPVTLSSARQYQLLGSDGSTWQPIDSTNLRTTVEFTTANDAVITGNADLWTAVAGYNQDIGIRVTPQGGSPTIVAWKESGGFAGTFSPNAAAVQGTYTLAANTAYVIDLVWKANVANGAGGRATPSHIFAGAGDPGAFSPTTLDVFLYPTPSSGSLSTATHAAQYSLTAASPGAGTDWEAVDVNNLSLTFTPTVASTAYLSANADLWTSVGGINQDIGINVAPPCNNDVLTPQVSAWKESGGNAGTFSPNAAFVQDACTLSASTTYTVTLDWRSNHPIPSGQSIKIGAGNSPSFSPTTLFAQVVPSTAEQAAVINAQKTLTATNADSGTAFRAVDGNLTLAVSPGSTCTAWLTANADLWTANAGYNQDFGIDVTPQGGSTTLLAWKESGGFAGTFSPNAAFVQGTITLPAGNYTVTLVWRANRAMPNGASIWMAAGTNPNFSPTSLLAQLTC